MPTVAIVGRPNVGKSALFNQIIGRKMAIVHEQSGVTRDRVSAVARFEDKVFTLIDTGGLGLYANEKKRADIWDTLIVEQLEVALESADKIIFVTDAMTGISDLDKEVARLLRETEKPVIMAVNKADNDKLTDNLMEFSELCAQ